MVRTSQLNVGGNMDFFNMLERERLESKKICKTNAVTSIMDHELPADDVHIGPSDYVPWLTDRKWAHIRVEGQAFGDVPLNVEMKLEVWDSPELGRHRDRRCPLLQARTEPRHRRPARRPVLVPDEVAAEPAPRRSRARGHREVHREVRGSSAQQARRPQGAGQEGRRRRRHPRRRLRPRRLPRRPRSKGPRQGSRRTSRGRAPSVPAPSFSAPTPILHRGERTTCDRAGRVGPLGVRRHRRWPGETDRGRACRPRPPGDGARSRPQRDRGSRGTPRAPGGPK